MFKTKLTVKFSSHWPWQQQDKCYLSQYFFQTLNILRTWKFSFFPVNEIKFFLSHKSFQHYWSTYMGGADFQNDNMMSTHIVGLYFCLSLLPETTAWIHSKAGFSVACSSKRRNQWNEGVKGTQWKYATEYLTQSCCTSLLGEGSG